MDVYEKFLRSICYKFPKGYPDMSNEEDVLLLESLLEGILGEGFRLDEEKKLEYDILTDEAKKISQELISLLGITQDQIKPASQNRIVIYDDNRDVLLDRIEDLGKYGKRRNPTNGNFKVGGSYIILKPNASSGEYYELKPQKLGITLDEKISLSTLFKELEQGVRDNKMISDGQRKILLYIINKKDKPSQTEITSALSTPSFYNEILKNFGEALGALLYGKDKGSDSVKFPSAGNYPLIDYLLFNGDEQTQVSAKTSKGVGNTVKLADLKKIVLKRDGEISREKLEVIDTISDNSVLEGPLKLIEKIGSVGLKKELEEFYKNYPEFPKINNPYNTDAHFERIKLEKNLFKELNVNPIYNFNDLFNEYVAIEYIKYKLNPKTLESSYTQISPGNFNVSYLSKNTKNHDSDRVGLTVNKIK
tara:strand:+ start:804 stop:2063 length:1260 start_codon:yes stop_codon:yes gene_type:complete